jgi:hypothetical protein
MDAGMLKVRPPQNPILLVIASHSYDDRHTIPSTVKQSPKIGRLQAGHWSLTAIF